VQLLQIQSKDHSASERESHKSSLEADAKHAETDTHEIEWGSPPSPPPSSCSMRFMATGKYCGGASFLFNAVDPNCAQRCTAAKQCKYYTSYASNNWCQTSSTCYLQHAKDSSSRTYDKSCSQTTSYTVVSRGQYCASTSLLFDGIDYQCKTKCTMNTACRYYTLFPMNGWCKMSSSCSYPATASDGSSTTYMKTGGAPPSPTPSPWPGSCSYTFKGYSYSNDRYLADLSGKSFELCKDLCTNWRSRCSTIGWKGSQAVSNPCAYDCGGFSKHSSTHCTLFKAGSQRLPSSRTAYYEKTCGGLQQHHHDSRRRWFR